MREGRTDVWESQAQCVFEQKDKTEIETEVKTEAGSWVKRRNVKPVYISTQPPLSPFLLATLSLYSIHCGLYILSKRPSRDVLFMLGIDCDFGKKAFCPLNEESRVRGSANPRMDLSPSQSTGYWLLVLSTKRPGSQRNLGKTSCRVHLLSLQLFCFCSCYRL